MTDRENSPAFCGAAPQRATGVRRERAIGDGSSTSVSYVAFRLDHHIGRKAVSPSLKLLDHLGLIEIEPGPHLVVGREPSRGAFIPGRSTFRAELRTFQSKGRKTCERIEFS
jgi:hypothetical protein